MRQKRENGRQPRSIGCNLDLSAIWQKTNRIPIAFDNRNPSIVSIAFPQGLAQISCEPTAIV